MSILAHAETNPSWITPIAPFRIADNLYYVGSQDLASYLVVTTKGNILINANLASSPPQIRTSVEKLGFRWKDTKILLNSQAHDDHMGGAAEVIRATHAKNLVMDGDVSVVETGARTDFLAPSPNVPGYSAVHVDRVLHDQDTVRLGGVTLTAHKTAGTRADVLPGPCTLISRVSQRERRGTSSSSEVQASGRNTTWLLHPATP